MFYPLLLQPLMKHETISMDGGHLLKDIMNISKYSHNPKVIVSISSVDPPCKNGNVRITKIPLINNVEDVVVFLSLKDYNSNNYYISPALEKCKSLLQRNHS